MYIYCHNRKMSGNRRMNNKQKMKYLSLFIACICMLFSCTQEQSFVYEGRRGICFEHNSYRISMGSMPYSISDSTVSIPLTAVGAVSSQSRIYTLELIDTATTAQEGIQFQAFGRKHILPAGAMTDTLFLKIHRRKLDKDSIYTLAIAISEQGELPPTISELAHVKLMFDNRLAMPQWWSDVSYWLGEYDRRKYQKFIELNGTPITERDMNERKYDYLRIFKKVKTYFDDNPHEGVLFPDVHWEV